MRRQNISPTLNQRRSIMKISQCVTGFFHYQRMNVKKKRHCGIMSSSWAISKTISVI